MKLNKVCKKVLAYTLTTSMALGFFAVSNINLTTAWAAATPTTGEWSETSYDTIDADLITTGNVSMSNDTTLTIGTNKKVTVGNGYKISGAKALTVATKYTVTLTSSGEIGEKTVLSNDGISGGSIKNATIDVSALAATTLNNVTLENVTLTGGSGKLITVHNCKIINTAVDNTNTYVDLDGGNSINKQATTASQLASIKPTKFTNTTVTLTENDVFNRVDFSGAGNTIDAESDYSGSVLFDAKINAATDTSLWITSPDSNTTADVINYDNIATYTSANAIGTGTGNVILTTSNGAVRNCIKKGLFKPYYYYTTNTTSGARAESLQVQNQIPRIAKMVTMCTDSTNQVVIRPHSLSYALTSSGVKATNESNDSADNGKSVEVGIKSSIDYTDAGALFDSTENNNDALAKQFFSANLTDTTKGVTIANLKINSVEDGMAAVMIGKSKAEMNGDGTRSVNGKLKIGGITSAVKYVSINTANALSNENVLLNQGRAYGFNDLANADLTNSVDLNKVSVPKELYGKTLVQIGKVGESSSNAVVAKEQKAFTQASDIAVNVFTVSSTGTVKTLSSGDDYTKSVVENANGFEVKLQGKGAYQGTYVANLAKYDQILSTTFTNAAQVSTIFSSGTGIDKVSLSDDDSSFKTVNEFVSANPTLFKDAGEYKFFYKTGSEKHTGLIVVDKYSIVDGAFTWEPASGSSAAYTGEAQAPAVKKIALSSASGLTNATDITSGFTYTYIKSGDTPKIVDKCVNKGVYTILANLSDADSKNYEITPAVTGGYRAAGKATFTITPSNEEPKLVSGKDSTVYYDGRSHKIDVKYDIQDESYKVAYYSDEDMTKEDANSFSEEGTHKLYYKLIAIGADGNYSAAKINSVKGEATLTIAPLDVKITSPSKTVAYTGKDIAVKASATSNGSAVSGATITLYAKNVSKDGSKYVEVKNGIKDEGIYSFKYSVKVGDQVISGACDETVKVAKASIAKATATAKTVTYNGKNQTPAVTVKLSGKTLKKGTDYTINSAKRINAGKYTIVITGKGNYTGTKKITFTINKRNVKYATIKKAYKKVKGKKVLKSYTVYYGKTKLVNKKNFKLITKKVKSGKKYVNKKYVQGIGNYTGYKAF